MPSESAIPIEPVMRMGRRPILSTSAIATSVTRMFTTPVTTLMMSESACVKPTAAQSSVE